MPYTILFINTGRRQVGFSLAWDGGASPGTGPVPYGQQIVPLTIQDADLPPLGTSVWAVANWTDWDNNPQSRTSSAFPLAAQGSPGSTMLCTFYEPAPQFIVQALPVMAPVMYEGMVARVPTNGAIYVMLDGAMRHIPNPEVLIRMYDYWQGWTSVDSIGGYPQGTPISMDAYLLKGDGGSDAVYLWVDGAKRLIVNMLVFNRFNFNAQRIQTVPQAQVDAMPEGPIIV